MKSKSFLGVLVGLSCVLSCAAFSQVEPSENTQWLSYQGSDGPGKGKHVVLIAADQEYRSEQAMPMLARILSQHHGFDCTVLFSVNDDGWVDPTLPTPKRGEEAVSKKHNIPGLEHLAKADSLILFSRFMNLPDDQQKQIVDYLDSGKPMIALRSANHGFATNLPYRINGEQVTLSQILGGTFIKHHGEWQADSTRGDIVPEMKDHPIVAGVSDIWGLTDVYRTFPEGAGLPEGSTALVYGQPLIGRKPGGANNPEKEPLPVVWFKNWITSQGKEARVLHSTMGSGTDFENPGLRRLVVNGVYWGLNMEDKISPDGSVDYVGDYKPLSNGFNYEKLGVIPRPVSYYRD
jgi:hypothetical protein